MRRILHFNLSDNLRGGGCAIMVYRLNAAMNAAGADSRILCWRKTTSDPSISVYQPSFVEKKIETRLMSISKKIGLRGFSSISSFRLKKQESVKNADILHFHEIYVPSFNSFSIPSLSQAKPTVLTLHDNRAFTGNCSFNFDCNRFVHGCGQCPYPDEHPRIRRDNTHLVWKLKKWIYSRSKMAVIALNTLQMQQVKQSILHDFPIYLVPNGVDTSVFHPLDSEKCRYVLGIPKHKKVILFSALYPGYRKGSDLLIAALNKLPDSKRQEYLVLTMGENSLQLKEKPKFETFNLGYVLNDHFKTVVYSAADIFVMPSRAEACSLVTLETMACGTPAVAFRVGAHPDLIEHGVNGYVAEPENVQDMSRGILELLGDDNLKNAMAENAVKTINDSYTLDHQVNNYFKVYNDLLH
jgi:glycosyltransferase involved in cell wall biosynthesis